MHTYSLAILLSLLLVSSFLKLPNPVLIEARKLVSSSNGRVFKINLIHRNSPLSPYYNSSMTPKERLKRSSLGSISRGLKIQLSSTYYHTIGDVELFDLIPNGGDYLMKIALGTPEVEFIATADTGSDLMWVQCSACEKYNCLPQKSPLFDPTKSSTFQMIPCTSSACNKNPSYHSHCLSNDSNNDNNESSPSPSMCGYEVSYGDGTQSDGILATEIIALPSSSDTTTSTLSLSSSLFGCGLNQTGTLGTGEGIIGLGTGPSSLISQLGPTINYKFSYCLAPLTSNIDSKLAFGADVMGSGVVSTPFTTGGDTTFYHLILNGISIGDENTPVQMPSRGLDMIIDSGTTLTLLPSSVYISLRATLVSAIELSTVPAPQESYHDLCYNSGEQFNPPNVVFHFEGADVVLKAINIFREVDDGVTCLAMMATKETAIFGNIAQVNFHVGYDLKAKQVSFLPTDCTISPRSPSYSHFMSRKDLLNRLIVSSASKHNQIKWQLSSLGVANSNLIPNQGDYLMEIAVGTPPVELVAVAVTGSDLTWFQCKPCILCYQQNTTMFDPESSKTFKNLPCDAQHCSNLDQAHINCDQQENLCRYSYTYGNATTLTQGVMGNDTISFTTSNSQDPVDFPSIAFGCGYQQYGFFDNDSAGVVGLGNGPISLISQLGPSISYKFSYCLNFVASHNVSKLRFGGSLDNNLVNNVILTTPLITTKNSSTFYNLGLNGISIGQMNMNMNKIIIIDTGTTLTYLDPSIFSSLEVLVNNAIGASPVSNNPLVEPVLCYDTTIAALTPPDIVLHFIGGDLVLKAENVFFEIDIYLCLSITKSPRDGDPMVLGNMAQVNFEVEFDLLSKTVSFAPRDCSNA
ncbi:Aspartic proteinase CDR1 [Bienertia sinuspersici]